MASRDRMWRCREMTSGCAARLAQGRGARRRATSARRIREARSAAGHLLRWRHGGSSHPGDPGGGACRPSGAHRQGSLGFPHPAAAEILSSFGGSIRFEFSLLKPTGPYVPGLPPAGVGRRCPRRLRPFVSACRPPVAFLGVQGPPEIARYRVGNHTFLRHSSFSRGYRPRPCKEAH